jgi:hypothetical protein
MNTAETSPVARRSSNRTRVATHIAAPRGASRWSKSSIAAVMLAGGALAGRVVSFFLGASSSVNVLCTLLIIAVAAKLLSGRMRYRTGASAQERKLVGMAKRIAGVQMLMSVVLIGMAAA